MFMHRFSAIRPALLLAVCGILIAGFTATAQAAAAMVKSQAPAFYRIMLGDIEVTALLDENSPWPENVDVLFPKMPAEQKQMLFTKLHLQQQYSFSTIAFLLNTGKKLILIDAGGRGAAATYGQLFPNLLAAGYRPEQVDDIYLTHMHHDHIGGLSEHGIRTFPNATVHADVDELPQWQTLAAQGNARARAVLTQLQPYIDAKKYQAFAGDTEFFPGFRAMNSHGHTAGHSFYALESKGQKMVFWGDFLLNDKVQLELPDTPPPEEPDTAKSIALHKSVFADAATQGYLVAGAHFAFPGIGRVRDLGGKYIWLPVDYATIPAK